MGSRKWAYPIHDFGPSFERDALKDGEHSETEVVEVSDAVVGTGPRVVLGADPLRVDVLVAVERRRRRIVPAARHRVFQRQLT